MTQMTLVKAINAGLRRALEANPKVLLAGEDIGKLGGVFRATEGLQKEFGENRVIDSPLAESGIVGTAVGLAMRGYRPVVEIQFDGFLFPGFDQMVTQVAKFHFRTGGAVQMPMVIRIPYGGGIGAIEHHSESPEAYFAHTAGMKVVTPSNPNDAYWMIQQAVASQDPVVFLEPKRRYNTKGEVELERKPMPLHQAKVVRSGSDVTLLAYGPMVKTCLEAAAVGADEGRSIEVVDLRTLSPIDWVTVLDSVRRTRRAIVVHEAPGTVSLSSEIAARLHEELFYLMEAPVLRVTGYDTPYPSSKVEDEYLPDPDRVLDAVDRSLDY